MEHKLEYLLNEEIKTFYLNKETVTVGKLESNDFYLNDNSVSRSHCKFIKSKNTYKIVDLKSTNGTYVNGKRISEEILKVGDNITVGRTIIKFLVVSRKEEYYDLDDQKISMIMPLSDEFEKEKEKKVVAEDLNFFTSLTELGKNLIISPTLENSFEKVGDLIFDLLNPKRVFIFFYDEVQGELELKYSRKVAVSDSEETEKINISKTIAMKAIKEKVAILSSNTKDDARFDGAQSIIMYGITSAVSVPIWTKNSIYGLIYIDTTSFDQMFHEKDLEIISIIANFTGLSIEGINSLKSLNQEKKFRARLERYHSPAIVSRIMKKKDDSTQELTAYKETEASVFFMDIVSFTTKVEEMEPSEIGVFLNNFFTEMTEIIFKHNGTLDKYIGDSIMAVFGVPFEIDNHAELSIRAALDMMKKLKEMNKNLEDKDKIQIRIGINSGKLIDGEFGSPKRLDYTVIGNTVNIASRLESSVAGVDEIVVTEDVHKQTKNKFIFKELGDRKLQGLTKEVKVYRVIKKKGDK